MPELEKIKEMYFLTKCIFDDILWVCSLESLSKECEEHGEVNGPGSLVHHALQIVV